MTAKNTTPRAYVLFDRTNEDHGQRVVYALTARDARRCGLDNVEYIDVGTRRAPQFDRFQGTGGPGVADLIAAGWWFECSNCGTYVTEYVLADGDGRATEGGAWCSQTCETRAQGRDRGYRFARAELAAAEDEAQRRWPDATVLVTDWNRSGYREPLPADGFRIFVRLRWIRDDADVYATWWLDAADHDGEERYAHARGAA